MSPKTSKDSDFL